MLETLILKINQSDQEKSQQSLKYLLIEIEEVLGKKAAGIAECVGLCLNLYTIRE